MKIRLLQHHVVLGVFERNFTLHLDAIAQARVQGVDLLVFPELSLTGYLLRDLIEEIAIPTEELARRFENVLGPGRPLEFVVGYVEQSEGFRLYNAAAHFRVEADGALLLLHRHRKVNLPTYGMFDEHRYFNPGVDVRAYDSPLLGRCGLLICEDFWHLANPLLLSLDGPDHDGAQALICLSNSPARGVTAGNDGAPDNLTLWRQLCLTIAQLSNALVLHCQRVGVEEGFIFSGGSAVVTPEGDLAAEAPALDEATTDAEIDLKALLRRSRLKFRGRAGDDIYRLHAGLTRLLKD